VTSIFQKLQLPVAADTHRRVSQSSPSCSPNQLRARNGVVSHTDAASEPHFERTGGVRA